MSINGYEPAAAGTYPVFVYVTGTKLSPASAISVVASRPKADVSKGLVVMGFSQGANIASLAKNYDAAVEAVFLIGNGYNNMGLTCYPDSATAITADRSRSVMGANDAAYVSAGYGGSLDANRQVMETTSGVSCGPTAASCTAPDGSGWYLVQSFETAAGKEDHCFHYASSFCGTVPFDANFLGGSFFWSLGPSLDWLASFTTPLGRVRIEPWCGGHRRTTAFWRGLTASGHKQTLTQAPT